MIKMIVVMMKTGNIITPSVTHLCTFIDVIMVRGVVSDHNKIGMGETFTMIICTNVVMVIGTAITEVSIEDITLAILVVIIQIEVDIITIEIDHNPTHMINILITSQNLLMFILYLI